MANDPRWVMRDEPATSMFIGFLKRKLHRSYDVPRLVDTMIDTIHGMYHRPEQYTGKFYADNPLASKTLYARDPVIHRELDNMISRTFIYCLLREYPGMNNEDIRQVLFRGILNVMIHGDDYTDDKTADLEVNADSDSETEPNILDLCPSDDEENAITASG